MAAAAACGEKLLILGRGIRFQSRHTPRAASVLLYLPQSVSGRPLSDPHLESALREAGHAVRVVTTNADLESALRSATFDVVLANVTDAADLERTRTVTERNAVVLPAVYLVVPTQREAAQQTKADRAQDLRALVVGAAVAGFMDALNPRLFFQTQLSYAVTQQVGGSARIAHDSMRRSGTSSRRD